MKYFILIVFLIIGCGSSTTKVENENGGADEIGVCGNKPPSMQVFISNIPSAISPSDITVVVVDSYGAKVALSRYASNDSATASFQGTAKAQLMKYTATIYQKGVKTNKSFQVGEAAAYCNYNSSYDWQTGQSSTGV